MKTRGVFVLAGAMLALAGRALSDCPDPEPPPPIKVDNVRGATVTAYAGRNGPIIKVKTLAIDKDKPKAKAKAKSKAKTSRLGACEVSFSDKQAPGRLTLRFNSHARLTLFSLTSGTYTARMSTIGGKGQQVIHFNESGLHTTDEQAAVLTCTVTPGAKYLEVEIRPSRGKPGLKPPWTVTWRGPVKPAGNAKP